MRLPENMGVWRGVQRCESEYPPVIVVPEGLGKIEVYLSEVNDAVV